MIHARKTLQTPNRQPNSQRGGFHLTSKEWKMNVLSSKKIFTAYILIFK